MGYQVVHVSARPYSATMLLLDVIGVTPTPKQLLLKLELPVKLIVRTIIWVQASDVALPLKVNDVFGKYRAPVKLWVEPPPRELLVLLGALRSWKKISPESEP